MVVGVVVVVVGVVVVVVGVVVVVVVVVVGVVVVVVVVPAAWAASGCAHSGTKTAMHEAMPNKPARNTIRL